MYLRKIGYRRSLIHGGNLIGYIFTVQVLLGYYYVLSIESMFTFLQVKSVTLLCG